MSGSTNIICRYINGQGNECRGELMFSYEIAGENGTTVYICKKCGNRTEVS